MDIPISSSDQTETDPNSPEFDGFAGKRNISKIDKHFFGI